MAKLKYKELHGYKYLLMRNMQVAVDIPVNCQNDYIILRDGVLTMREDYAWDGASGPAMDTPDFMRGSLFHDGLYQLMREKLLDIKYRDAADRLLQKICLEDGMGKFRAGYVYQFVRWFAKSAATNPSKLGKVVEI